MLILALPSASPVDLIKKLVIGIAGIIVLLGAVAIAVIALYAQDTADILLDLPEEERRMFEFQISVCEAEGEMALERSGDPGLRDAVVEECMGIIRDQIAAAKRGG